MLLVQLARPTAVGFPEGIEVTVLTWQSVCYYVFNDRGSFYSLSTCHVKLTCPSIMVPLGISLYLRRKALIDQLLY